MHQGEMNKKSRKTDNEHDVYTTGVDENQNKDEESLSDSAFQRKLHEADAISPIVDNFNNIEFNNSYLSSYRAKKTVPKHQNHNIEHYKSPSERSHLRNLTDEFALFKRQQPKKATGPDYFSKVADEVILHIFKMLPKPVLVKCSLVCKRWKLISYDQSLWTQYDFGRRNLKPGTLGCILTRGISVLRLAMAEIRTPIFTKVDLDDSWYSNLQYLDLSMTVITTEDLALLLSKCLSLKKLSVEHCTLNRNCCLNIAENDQLQVLNMAMTRGITEDGIRAISIDCKKLTEWNLGWADLDEDCMKALLPCIPVSMKRLNLSGHRNTLTDDGLEIVVKRCKDLIELDVSDCSKLSSVSIESIAKYCLNMEHLHTSRCYNINAEAYKLLKNLKNLKILDIFQTLTDNGLSILREMLSHLKINKHMFSTVARPTVGIRRTSIWGIKTRD